MTTRSIIVLDSLAFALQRRPRTDNKKMASPLLARAPPAASIMACRSSIDCLSASRTLSASPLATGSARRHQSTSTDAPNAASPNAFVAAREQSLASLSTRIFNPKLLRSSHPVGYARNRTDPSSGPGRPENIAYFTANAKYYNLVIALNEAIRRNGLDFRDKSVYEKAALPSWMNANIMSEVHDMNLENGRYEEIVHKLNMLFAIRSGLKLGAELLEHRLTVSLSRARLGAHRRFFRSLRETWCSFGRGTSTKSENGRQSGICSRQRQPENCQGIGSNH